MGEKASFAPPQLLVIEMVLKTLESPSPLSSTTTLSSPASPHPNKTQESINNLFSDPRIPASTLIEYISSRAKSSSIVYVYDIAEQVGFGTQTKEWTKTTTDTARVVDLQTRSGAGLSLVGRLSQGTSLDAAKGTVLTAYTTPNGLAQMALSFSYLPLASTTSRLIVQVPTVTPVGETLTLSPTLSSLAPVWSILPDNVTVLLSSTPKQAVDFATLSFRLTKSHVIHLFDHHSSSREIGHSISPLQASTEVASTIQDAVRQAGYSFFEYHGDKAAKTVIVLLNGPFAAAAKAAIRGNNNGLGIIIVNVLRPWDESAIRAVIPSPVTVVHVLDDVPNEATQGNLYADVLSALWNTIPKRRVQSHRITPSQTQNFVQSGGAFWQFLQKMTHFEIEAQAPADNKGVLLFSVPRSPLASFPTLLEELFFQKSGILSRLLTDYDVFSRPGGLTASRLVISGNNVTDLLPIPIALPLEPNSTGASDFLGIFDENLLKTHSILKHAKTGSVVLIATSWTPKELLENVPQEFTSLALNRKLSIYIVNVKDLAKNIVGAEGPIQDAAQNLLLEFVFLRLYLGPLATESTVLQLIRTSSNDTLGGITLTKFSSHAWSGLQLVDIPHPVNVASPNETLALKGFEVNAIAVETTEGKTIINGAHLSSWHDAAKHLLFPSIFTPSQHRVDDGLCNPALRPEIPDTTFLVTCTVNKRLTPLEYDRNVFHLEFDTSGTGLKYAIGEALGVHGWNDEQEVLDFCSWYGVDPQRLITIPIIADESRMHTRTVMQALQQQIDLFGRPPKSFYTDLADYAAADVDRYALRFIGSPEGSSTFKKLSEKDTVTFADVLKSYKSAKPGIERLCELIGDIKPRHYSIASAQSVVGDRIDLLVVTVDWLAPDGKCIMLFLDLLLRLTPMEL